MAATSELFGVMTVNTARELLLHAIEHFRRHEYVPLDKACGRVLAADIVCNQDLPQFRRSVVDGYAVRANETYGASAALPAYFRVTMESAMGRNIRGALGVGEAARVHTGSSLPESADAVIMVEHTAKLERSDSDPCAEFEMEAFRAVAPGENILLVGEDVSRGSIPFRAGQELRPQDIGGLAALGFATVLVADRPRIGIISSGDEIIAIDVIPNPGQIRDVNSHALGALVRQSGAESILFGVVADDREDLIRRLRHAHQTCDAVVLSAGSSVSNRDFSLEAIESLCDEAVLAHGLSIKPGKPTIVAVFEGKPILGLPGNPVSAMIVAERLLVPLIRHMLGTGHVEPVEVVAKLGRAVASVNGREDYVQVQVGMRAGELWAEPLFGKSNSIFTMVHANGVICIPLNATGLEAGSSVMVTLQGKLKIK